MKRYNNYPEYTLLKYTVKHKIYRTDLSSDLCVKEKGTGNVVKKPVALLTEKFIKSKKLISGIVSACLIISIMGINASAVDDLIYENIVRTPIANGIVHSAITRFYNDGWQKINVIEADFSIPDINLQILTGQDGVKRLSTVSTMAKNNGSIAAINADFFDTNSSERLTGSALGMIISDSELMSTPSHDGMPVIAQSEDNDISVNVINYDLTVTAPNGEKHSIIHLNKYMQPMYLTMYDKNWGKISPGSHDDGIEVVVEDGIVTNILSNSDGVEIPENGYVLNHSLRYDLFLADNFEIGSEVILTQTFTPDIDDIKNAVGGSTFLVKDGEIAEFTYKTSGVNPKTAAGIDESGETLYLVTVDGRSQEARGMTQTELAQFMIELGAYTAIDFDGGGSTTMVAKLPDSDGIQVINSPSGGTQRNVANALGIEDTSPIGEFSILTITPDKPSVFIGDRLEFNVSGYDEGYHKLDITDEEISYTSQGGDVAVNRIFYPKEKGTQTIKGIAKNGIKGFATVDVLDDCKRLEIIPQVVDLSDKGVDEVTVKGYDDNGFSAQISSDMVDWEIISGNGADIYDGKVESTGMGGVTIIRASFGDAEGYFAVTTSSTDDTDDEDTDSFYIPETYIPDKFLKTVEGSAAIGFFGDGVTDDTLFSELMKSIRNKRAAEFDAAVFKLMPINAPDNSISASRGYNMVSEQGTAVITINNTGGGIRAADAQQWHQLIADVENISEKNIFICLPYMADSSGFSSVGELSLFKQTLKKFYDNDKNVFVVSYGVEADYKVLDGVRYITVPQLPVYAEDMFYGLYLKVGIDGDDVGCEFVPYLVKE